MWLVKRKKFNGKVHVCKKKNGIYAKEWEDNSFLLLNAIDSPGNVTPMM